MRNAVSSEGGQSIVSDLRCASAEKAALDDYKVSSGVFAYRTSGIHLGHDPSPTRFTYHSETKIPFSNHTLFY